MSDTEAEPELEPATTDTEPEPATTDTQTEPELITNTARRVAFLGPQGTFAEAALRRLPDGSEAIRVPEVSVVAVIDAVRDGTAAAGVVPLENSVEGAVPATLDELASGSPLRIEHEVFVQVEFVFAVRRGTGEVRTIATVATHPHAEAQCRRWLRANVAGARVALTTSTAAAASAVAAGEYDAAVCAEVAAEVYDLEIRVRGIGDNDGAITRFISVARPAPPTAPTGADRTSLVAFIRENHTGALLEVLTEFAIRGINLTRIESRPTKALMGQYCFFIDAEGHIADARVGEAMAALRRVCGELRYLGSYPRADGSAGVAAPEGRRDPDFAASAGWLAAVRRCGTA